MNFKSSKPCLALGIALSMSALTVTSIHAENEYDQSAYTETYEFHGNEMSVTIDHDNTQKTVAIATEEKTIVYALAIEDEIIPGELTLEEYYDFLYEESPKDLLTFILLPETQQQDVVDLLNSFMINEDFNVLTINEFGESLDLDPALQDLGVILPSPNLAVQNKYCYKVQNIYAAGFLVAQLKIDLTFAVYGTIYAQYISGNAVVVKKLIPNYPITRSIYQLYNAGTSAICYARWNFGYGTNYAIGQACGYRTGNSEANIWPYYF